MTAAKTDAEKGREIAPRGEKDNCGPGFMYGIVGRIGTEAPAVAGGVAERAVVLV